MIASRYYAHFKNVHGNKRHICELCKIGIELIIMRSLDFVTVKIKEEPSECPPLDENHGLSVEEEKIKNSQEMNVYNVTIKEEPKEVDEVCEPGKQDFYGTEDSVQLKNALLSGKPAENVTDITVKEEVTEDIVPPKKRKLIKFGELHYLPVKKVIGEAEEQVNPSAEHGDESCANASVQDEPYLEAGDEEEDSTLQRDLSDVMDIEPSSMVTVELGNPSELLQVTNGWGQKVHYVQNKFTCGTCSLTFEKSLSELSSHIHAVHNNVLSTYNNVFTFTCRFCPEVFKTQSKIFEHLKTHEISPFYCQSCRKMYITLRQVQRECVHVCSYTQVHSVECFPCGKCQRLYSEKSELEAHMRKIHRKRHPLLKNYACVMCPMKFFNVSELKAHAQKHESDSRLVESGTNPQYSCKFCQKMYTSETLLQAHMLVHSPKNLVCNVCAETFSDTETQRKHMAKHHKNTYKCFDCKIGFDEESAFHKHIRRAHGKRFTCEICFEGFNQIGLYERHMTSSHRPYSCTKCDKTFLYQCRLDIHMLSHAEEATEVGAYLNESEK